MAVTRQALRQRRKQRGWSQEGIAHALGVAVSTYKSWESGHATPRDGFRPRLAKHLDVSLAQVDIYLNTDRQGTATPDGHQVPPWLNHLASLEQGASRIWAYEPLVVQGLLQTADYAYAVLKWTLPDATDEKIARRVDLRIARQAVLTREPDPLALSVVLDESVLHRVADNHEVMADQLNHLIEMADYVDLRIVGLDKAVLSGGFGAFKVLSKAVDGGHEPYMAYVEDRVGPHYLDRPHELDAHIRLWKHIATAALSPADSIDLIQTTIKERYR